MFSFWKKRDKLRANEKTANKMKIKKNNSGDESRESQKGRKSITSH